MKIVFQYSQTRWFSLAVVWTVSVYLTLQIGIFLLMTYHWGSKLQDLFLTESIECQNNFLVVTNLMKLGSCDKAVKISGGAKGAEQTYKRLAQKPLKVCQKTFFIHFLCLISGIWCVSTLLNRQLRNSQREQFFHQRIIFVKFQMFAETFWFLWGYDRWGRVLNFASNFL